MSGRLILLMFIQSIFLSQFVYAKTFVYCSEASPKIFNPQLATDGATFNASSRTIYNRLVEFDGETTRVVPSLAKSWKVAKNALEYTFYLRKDVPFHTTNYFKPTRNFTADDVLFSFNRMRLKNHPYHSVNGGTYKYFAGMDMGSLIKDLVKIDDYTVKFVLTRPEAPFIANMAMDFASILSQEYATQLIDKKQKEMIDIIPVGTGPFVFNKYIKDSLIRYSAHPRYFKGVAKLEKLVFAITPDANVRTQKLKAGECHFIAEPSPIDIAELKKLKNLKVTEQAGLNIGYLAFNTQKKPFDNPLVRQAINHALNRDLYIEAIYLGHAKKAKNPIPPTMWSYNTKGREYKYNPQRARELLKQAGYASGFETDLWTLPVSRPYNPNGKKMGEMMQADLAKIGVKVNLVTYKWGEYLKRGSSGEHSLIQLGWTGDNGDPDNFLYVLLGCAGIEAGSNYARWCNKKFQSLIDRAKVSAEQSVREKLYKQAQNIFKREAPWVTLVHSTVFKAMSEKVQGYQQSPFGSESFYNVDLK